MILVFDVEDAGFALLPCGCRIFDIKVFDKGVKVDGVYRVEALPLSVLYKKSPEVGYWRVMQMATNEKGNPIIHNGRPMKTEFSSHDIELRCKHWKPEGA
jgi:hypothetical protein